MHAAFAALLIINGLKADAAFCSLPENENAAFCNLSFSTKSLNGKNLLGNFAKDIIKLTVVGK
ncbi:hypothetical protein SFC43_13725 [Bacteroides sp. CR5/BHMF/2]|nr:hypothetical protein [Bacteroides sp. CR5/BHMF/2]